SFSRTVKEEPKIVYDFKPAQTESKRPASHAASRLGPGQYAVPNNKTYKRLMELQTKFTVCIVADFSFLNQILGRKYD
ncbi:hypothetical protein PoB_004740600, partial [Plakobranchus ocellatus]